MGKRGNGEGTIYKRSDGLWTGQCMITLKDGTVKRKTIYGKTQKIVKDKIHNILEKEKQGYIVETSDIILEDWVELWLKEYKTNLKITTKENYYIYFKKHIKGSLIGKKAINKLTALDMQRFYNKKFMGDDKNKELSSTTVRYINIIISGALNQAVRNKLVNDNVCKSVVLPAKKRVEIVPLTVQEVKKFLNVAKYDRLYALYLLEMMTGMRRGEILGLKWEDIDFENKKINIRHNLCIVNNDDENTTKKTKLVLLDPKTEKSKRTIPINMQVIYELQEHRKRQEDEKENYQDIYKDMGMVFCKVDGNYIYPRDFLRQYQGLLQKAGIEIKRFHDLRHTVASIMINENENPRVIQELLGHSQISTTMDIYAHVMEETKIRSLDNLYKKLSDI